MTPARRCAAAAALALLVAGLLSACSTSPYAAKVNGTTISQSTLLRELHALGTNKDFVTAYDTNVAQAAAQGQVGSPIFAPGTAAKTYTQRFTAIVLNTDIQAALVHDEVVRRHIEPSAADVAAATAGAEQQFPSGTFPKFNAWFRAEYQLRTAEHLALAKVLGPAAGDNATIQAFYKQNPQDFIATECVSHVLVATKARALDIRAHLVAGAGFADEARRYSTDTASAVKGGDLGCAAPGNYDPAFEVVADTIALNQVSQPVHSQFGWHLIEVRSRQMQGLDTTNSGRIKQYLQQDPVRVFLGPALQAAKVSVNAAYGTWDGVSRGVVAPVPPPAAAGVPTPNTIPPTSTP